MHTYERPIQIIKGHDQWHQDTIDWSGDENRATIHLKCLAQEHHKVGSFSEMKMRVGMRAAGGLFSWAEDAVLFCPQRYKLRRWDGEWDRDRAWELTSEEDERTRAHVIRALIILQPFQHREKKSTRGCICCAVGGRWGYTREDACLVLLMLVDRTH